MLPPEESAFMQLMSHFAQSGEVVWMGVRPASRQAVQVITKTFVRIGTGLDGDRQNGNAESKRQVTLIQAEHLQAAASYLGKAEIDPALVRRNIVVKGINLLALKEKRFRVGEVLLEYTGLCHPCSRMEVVLGAGGYNAMRGHGGITARVIEEGFISLNDSLTVIEI